MIWKLFCFVGLCPCEPYSDDGGCGGRCLRCGKIVGYVDRKTLRAYADAEMQWEWSKQERDNDDT